MFRWLKNKWQKFKEHEAKKVWRIKNPAIANMQDDKQKWESKIKYKYGERPECKDKCFEIMEMYPPSTKNKCPDSDQFHGYLACNLDHNKYINCHRHKVTFPLSALSNDEMTRDCLRHNASNIAYFNSFYNGEVERVKRQDYGVNK